MTNSKPTTSRHQILADHKKQGKRLVPPFVYKAGTLSEVSWVNDIMPQVIWIVVAIDRLGFAEGVSICLALARAAHEVHNTHYKNWFVWMSVYAELTSDEWQKIKRTLLEAGQLEPLQRVVEQITYLYPKCPMQPILSVQLDEPNSEDSQLQKFRTILTELYSRRSILATRTQATVIYIALMLDLLHIAKTTLLSELHEVELYPDTEKSMLVAASVRAAINGFWGAIPREKFHAWSAYFWNQGLELEPCQIASNWGEAADADDQQGS